MESENVREALRSLVLIHKEGLEHESNQFLASWVYETSIKRNGSDIID